MSNRPGALHPVNSMLCPVPCRWWEGRKAWGQITSASQNLLRQASAYLPPEDAALLEGLARWIAAMAWSVKAMFRPNSDLASDLQVGSASHAGSGRDGGRLNPVGAFTGLQGCRSINRAAGLWLSCASLWYMLPHEASGPAALSVPCDSPP